MEGGLGRFWYFPRPVQYAAPKEYWGPRGGDQSLIWGVKNQKNQANRAAQDILLGRECTLKIQEEIGYRSGPERSPCIFSGEMIQKRGIIIYFSKLTNFKYDSLSRDMIQFVIKFPEHRIMSILASWILYFFYQQGMDTCKHFPGHRGMAMPDRFWVKLKNQTTFE